MREDGIEGHTRATTTTVCTMISAIVIAYVGGDGSEMDVEGSTWIRG